MSQTSPCGRVADVKKGRKHLRIDEKSVILCALAAGSGAVLAGASPTGDPLVDGILTGLSVAGVTWVAGAAHWWLLTLAASLTIATVGDLLLAGCALGSLVLALWIGSRRSSHSTLRSLCAGLILNLLIRSELGGFLGLSAIIGFAVAVALVISGSSRRPRRQRRWIIATCASALAVAVLGAGAVAASAWTVRSNIAQAVDSIRDGVDQLSEGDLDAAASTLAEAAQELNRASDWVGKPWTQPGRLVPVVAQHRFAAVDLTAGAADLAVILSEELDVLDFGSLKPVDGRIDIESLERVQTSAQRLLTEVEKLSGTLDDARSIWLAGPLARELDDFDGELSTQVESARRTNHAVQMAPAMLGKDGLRRYFIAFTTPAEARGGGGFMGSWAEIEIDDGQIALTRTGRTGELNDAGSAGRSITGPQDFIDRYGPFGFTTGDGETTARDIWSTVNMSAHFPSTGDVIAQLYPQSGGSALDGVFSLDVETLAKFLEFTGPISVDGLTEPLDAENAVEFLLFNQYRSDGTTLDRVDVLESVTRQVVDRLLDGALPEPQDLIESMAPMVSEGRLLGYAVRPEEQELFADLKMTGAIEAPTTGDVLSVAFNNATASKLELFLDAQLDVTTIIDANGRANSSVQLELTNSAPTSGWPSGVIGNYIGLPTGYNRLWLTLTSRLSVVSTRLDGVEIDAFSSTENGLNATDWFIDIAPGDTVTLSVTLQGTLIRDNDPETFPMVLRLPPLVRPMTATVTVDDRASVLYSATFDRPGIFR